MVVYQRSFILSFLLGVAVPSQTSFIDKKTCISAGGALFVATALGTSYQWYRTRLLKKMLHKADACHEKLQNSSFLRDACSFEEWCNCAPRDMAGYLCAMALQRNELESCILELDRATGNGTPEAWLDQFVRRRHKLVALKKQFDEWYLFVEQHGPFLSLAREYEFLINEYKNERQILQQSQNNDALVDRIHPFIMNKNIERSSACPYVTYVRLLHERLKGLRAAYAKVKKESYPNHYSFFINCDQLSKDLDEIVLHVAGSSIFYTETERYDLVQKLKKHEERLKKISSEHKTLQHAVHGINVDVKGLKYRVSTLSGDIGMLNARVMGLDCRASVNAVAVRLNQLEKGCLR